MIKSPDLIVGYIDDPYELLIDSMYLSNRKYVAIDGIIIRLVVRDFKNCGVGMGFFNCINICFSYRCLFFL